jgi:hypothetical protein
LHDNPRLATATQHRSCQQNDNACSIPLYTPAGWQWMTIQVILLATTTSSVHAAFLYSFSPFIPSNESSTHLPSVHTTLITMRSLLAIALEQITDNKAFSEHLCARHFNLGNNNQYQDYLDPSSFWGEKVLGENSRSSSTTSKMSEKKYQPDATAAEVSSTSTEECNIDAVLEHYDTEKIEEVVEDTSDDLLGAMKPIPENMLQTDINIGLSQTDVDLRLKKYGLNQMKEEKENQLLKFVMFFVGPIQFVMEVSHRPCSRPNAFY